MIFDIVTIFPDLLHSPLQEGILRRAQNSGQMEVNIINLRDFSDDRHATTDDRPFGGGEGMVMKAEPLAKAVISRKASAPQARVILLSPQGKRFDQQLATELTECSHLILVCGRYEGVDERFVSHYVDQEISIGDYVLTGGELGAMVIIDAVTRLLPGVLGHEDSAAADTFSGSLLKHPQYTRPRVFERDEVPEILLSGDHEKIAEYRFLCRVERTLKKRPDLLTGAIFDKKQRALLQRAGLLEQVTRLQLGAAGNNGE